VDVGVLHLLQEKQARSLPFSQDDTPVNSSSSSLFCGVWSFNPVASDLHQVYEAVNHLQIRNLNSVACIGKDLLAARFGLLMMVATDEVLPAQSPAHMTLRYIEFGNRAPVKRRRRCKDKPVTAKAIERVRMTKKERPILYLSRVLRSYEKNYTILELELGAVVWSVLKLQRYLDGTPFTSWTRSVFFSGE
jgi:hypothetical protein